MVEKVVDEVMRDGMAASARGNAIYWIAVVVGGLLLNLVLLMIFARG